MAAINSRENGSSHHWPSGSLPNLDAYYEHIMAARKSGRPDVLELGENLGIDIRAKALKPSLCGYIAPTPNHWCITYNSTHRLSRQRFSIMHLIGHFIFHRDLMMPTHGGLIGTHDNLSYRQERESPFFNPRILTSHERQASGFAINLLMPAEIVTRLDAEGLSIFQIANHLSVSPEAMAVRLKSLRARSDKRTIEQQPTMPGLRTHN